MVKEIRVSLAARVKPETAVLLARFCEGKGLKIGNGLDLIMQDVVKPSFNLASMSELDLLDLQLDVKGEIGRRQARDIRSEHTQPVGG